MCITIPSAIVDEARARILGHARSPSETETVAVEAALGRVLAAPLVSTVSVPPMDNSAMDGYPLRLADHAPERWLKIGQRIPAGSLGQPLQPGEVARIFTGAPIPENADTVVMQEDCEARDGEVRITRPPRLGDHIRRAGEDIRSGQSVLASGTRLGPGQLGVAASVGAADISVYRRLRVAVFFTGDEIGIDHPAHLVQCVLIKDTCSQL